MGVLRQSRRIGKWCGLLLTIALVPPSCISFAYNCHYQGQAVKADKDGNGGILIMLAFAEGRLGLGYQLGESTILGWTTYRYRYPAKWWPEYTRIGNDYMLAVLPCWMIFLLFGGPTLALFWLDHRRIPPHCCQSCGYDLTGNTSGFCPERGMKTNSRFVFASTSA